MNPLEEFEKSFLKECIVLNKKFIFNLSSNLKSLNKVDVLCDCLVSVDDINLILKMDKQEDTQRYFDTTINV